MRVLVHSVSCAAVLALAGCGQVATGSAQSASSQPSGSGSTAPAGGSSGGADTTTTSEMTTATSGMATTKATSSAATSTTSSSNSALRWQEFVCGGVPCDPTGNPPWPDGGVTESDGGACAPLGSGCDSVGAKCGVDTRCGPAEVCESPNWSMYGGSPASCPISSRTHKQHIHYIDDAERESLADEALHVRLATYRYKPEAGDPAPTHLGFVIEDDPTSPAVTADRQHVDLYGYVSMAMATIQQQSREIAALRAQVDELSRGTCDGSRATSR